MDTENSIEGEKERETKKKENNVRVSVARCWLAGWLVSGINECMSRREKDRQSRRLVPLFEASEKEDISRTRMSEKL